MGNEYDNKTCWIQSFITCMSARAIECRSIGSCSRRGLCAGLLITGFHFSAATHTASLWHKMPERGVRIIFKNLCYNKDFRQWQWHSKIFYCQVRHPDSVHNEIYTQCVTIGYHIFITVTRQRGLEAIAYMPQCKLAQYLSYNSAGCETLVVTPGISHWSTGRVITEASVC